MLLCKTQVVRPEGQGISKLAWVSPPARQRPSLPRPGSRKCICIGGTPFRAIRRTSGLRRRPLVPAILSTPIPRVIPSSTLPARSRSGYVACWAASPSRRGTALQASARSPNRGMARYSLRATGRVGRWSCLAVATTIISAPMCMPSTWPLASGDGSSMDMSLDDLPITGPARLSGLMYPDGSPLPPHTYGYVQYDPVGNDYLLLKGQTGAGQNVKAVAIPHLFNLDTLRWRHGPVERTAILNSGGWTTWDASRRTLWGHSGDDGGGNAFIGFSPDGTNADGTCGRWSNRFPNKLPGIANENAMQIDPLRDVIVVAVHARNRLYALDPSDPGSELRPLESAGSKPVLQACAAMDYAPNLAGLVYFSPLDRGTVHLIAPQHASPVDKARDARWDWRAFGPVDGTLEPISDASRRSRYRVNLSQTFGRFRIASSARSISPSWSATSIAPSMRCD